MIPQGLVHVVARLYVLILFAQFDGPLRITHQVETYNTMYRTLNSSENTLDKSQLLLLLFAQTLPDDFVRVINPVFQLFLSNISI